ncbi:DUF899 domain-containing protein [Chelativorans sp. M5D2P16]|uniref:DUF899 domain-containing protein n=1 Tax=Chelativorans sp. M5D2P16 TaxID=3095678 RepID=UPI002ACAA207|nr:DUF899 domain-containing protein [Chelativorans sp. M5D2P16]MDZ5697949.1 DUF899 domain-containing protein [Chelativorans sp. M5D2P16]
MSLPEIVSREEWLEARKALLTKEKEMTRARDALSAERRRLPMVKVEKDYVFDGPNGKKRLIDLFEGRRQLIVDHFMFDPRWEKGCPGCTGDADEMSDGLIRHLNHRDTSFACISRAPLEKLERYKAERGWTFPWYSSYGSDFNYDFGVTIDENRAPAIYNYRTREEHQKAGTGYYFDGEPPAEAAGLSCFLRVGNDVYHTYSAFGRGDEAMGGAYYWLDLTALGRQEEWEEPKGRVESPRASLPFFDD